MGSNDEPFYRIVAIDHRRASDGRYLENLGWYDPKRKGTNYQLKHESIDKWVSQGAQVSDTVKSLLRKAARASKAAPKVEAAAAVEAE